MPLTKDRLDHRDLPDGATSRPYFHAAAGKAEGGLLSLRRTAFEKAVKEIGPDVVIAGPLQSGAYVAALEGQRPLVAVSWGSDVLVDADRSPVDRDITRFALDNSDLVFGDCRAVREAVKSHSGLTDEKIITFPWGIDLSRFTPGISNLPLIDELGWKGKDIFISTRSWEHLYAIDVLVLAFAAVAAARPEARLLLLGNGSLSADIGKQIASLGIDHLVHRPGRISNEELPEYFRAACAYVSSALSDGTSISLLEAMACGIPVIVTNAYGNLEWVTEGVNGKMAEGGDATSLAAAMLSVMSDETQRAKMGKANVTVARERANWEKNFPLLATAVEKLVAR